MTRRKRIVAWAVEHPDGEYDCLSFDKWHPDATARATGDRLVSLVEYDPRREAVVRAAIQWTHREAVVRAAIQWTHLALDRSTTGSPGRADAYDALLRAVKRLEGGKK